MALILKVVRNLLQTYLSDSFICFRYQMIVRVSPKNCFIYFRYQMNEMIVCVSPKTVSCSLPSDPPTKSSWQSPLSQPANFTGSWCLINDNPGLDNNNRDLVAPSCRAFVYLEKDLLKYLQSTSFPSLQLPSQVTNLP